MNTTSDSIRFVGEKVLLRLARVPRGTWNGWLRAGHQEASANGLYGERDVASVSIFNLIADVLPVNEAAIAWKEMADEVITSALKCPLDGSQPLVVVVDSHALDGAIAKAAKDLFELVTGPTPSPRGWIAIPITPVVSEARRGFWRFAKPASELTHDGRRKSTTGRRPVQKSLPD